MAIKLIVLLIAVFTQGKILLPVDSGDRHNLSRIRLTEIGKFGVKRKARPGIPEHYHTGIDIKRPGNNYDVEPIFPMAEGKVISKRTDGPYANLIIEHTINGKKVWSLYEHIAGITVNAGDDVKPSIPVARFMNKDELNRYGWQFDHFHFEIIKIKPLKMQSTDKTPERFFNSYSLVCYKSSDMEKYYYDPIEFLESNL